MKIFTVADVPDALAQAWLQHLRSFDAAYPGCHFQVMADAPDASIAEIVQVMQVQPEFTFTSYFERKKKK